MVRLKLKAKCYSYEYQSKLTLRLFQIQSPDQSFNQSGVLKQMKHKFNFKSFLKKTH